MQKKGKISSLLAIVCILSTIMTILSPGQAVVLCNQAKSMLTTCVPYLKLKGNRPDKPLGSCCKNVQALNTKYPTRTDRQALCHCLSVPVRNARRISSYRLSQLPKDCNVKLSFTVSRNMNCATVR